MGYTGGTSPDPTYHNLGDHTETLELDFDPGIISYAEIMEIFWKVHDPFRPSYCNQYAARVFYHDEEQRKVAMKTVERLEEEKGKQVLTAVQAYGKFYMAEDYHQKYYLKGNGPLIAEFRSIYPDEREFVVSTAVARTNGYLGGNGTLEQLKKELPMLGLSSEGQERLLKAFQRR